MGLLRTLLTLARGRFARARLRALDGPRRGRVFPLARPLTTLGAAPSADIRLAGVPAPVTIEALPALNRHRLRAPGAAGLRVNGTPVAGETWLSSGDRLTLGPHTLRLEVWHAPGRAKRRMPRDPSPPSNLPPPRYVGQDLSPPAPASPAPAPGYTPNSGGAGARLVCLGGPYAGQSFPLGHSPITFGRTGDASVSLPADPSLSPLHARITYAAGRYLLSDAEADGVTMLNGEALTEPQTLLPGDVLQMGDTTLRYE